MQKESTPGLREKLQDMKQRIIASGQYKVSEDSAVPGSSKEISLGKKRERDVFEEKNWDLHDEEEILVTLEDESEDGISDAEDAGDLDESDVEPLITEDSLEEAPDLGLHLAREVPDMEISLDEFDPAGDYAPTYFKKEDYEPVTPVEILGEELEEEEAVFIPVSKKGKEIDEAEEPDPELLAMEREFFGVVEEVIVPVMGGLQAEEEEEDFAAAE
ncbi:MAG: hypothetical protein CVV50_03525, partial [Spirochaetae bacterium HGW-Spirochaetae-6]